MSSRGLTPKQQRFVEEYLVDLNATQAAIRAGYSARTAEWIGPQLLGKTHVAEAVRAGRESLSKRTEITQERVLQEYARLAFMDPRKLFDGTGAPRPIHELDDDTAAPSSVWMWCRSAMRRWVSAMCSSTSWPTRRGPWIP